MSTYLKMIFVNIIELKIFRILAETHSFGGHMGGYPPLISPNLAQTAISVLVKESSRHGTAQSSWAHWYFLIFLETELQRGASD